MANCGSCGPGYASPKEAFYLAPKEKILYIPCIIPDKDRPDYLSTVDVDPESPTYQKVSDIYTNNIIKKIPIFMIFEVHVQEDRNTYVNSKGIKKEN